MVSHRGIGTWFTAISFAHIQYYITLKLEEYDMRTYTHRQKNISVRAYKHLSKYLNWNLMNKKTGIAD